MLQRKQLLTTMSLLVILVFGIIGVQAHGDEEDVTDINVRGTVVQAIGQYPDTMTYNGEGVIDLEMPGFYELHLDAENNVGLMFARFYVKSYQLNADTLLEDAQITVISPLFGSPTGIMPEYWEGGVATDVLLHGDSGQEAPVLPTVFNKAASWGPALIFVDGEQLMGAEKIMGAPNVMGAFAGHMMYSNEMRDPETGFVANADGDEPFSPMQPANGNAYDEDANLLHLIIRTEERDDEAFPPFTMFMHFNFLDVQEIDPLEDMDFMSFEGVGQMMKDMEMSAVKEQLGMAMGQWLSLVDDVEASLADEESEG
jgi:hypothetical protein